MRRFVEGPARSRLCLLVIQRHGIHNPYTGRGAIKDLLPHGPHNVRDVLATRILKKTGSYEQASYAIQDTPEMVARHSGRFPVRGADADDQENGAGEQIRPISPSTVNRLMNDLRAALNAAAEKHRRELPAGVLAEIKIGTRAVPIRATTARKQILTGAEIQALIGAAFEVDDTGDFGRLVLVAAATGARYSQIAAIQVRDVQERQARVLVPGSRKGRSLRAKPPASVPVTGALIERLQPALVGGIGTDPLLQRWAYRKVGPFEWERHRRRAWGPAYEIDKWWRACVSAAKLPGDTVMYALRHSSIVRGLTAGVPVRLVAALHDTSVEMIEAHYSAHITEATDEIARRAVLEL
ncbi:integrase [Angulomicrobium amanitiforme]|uniref:Integrase n=1 Tax=Ancylobacter amanitiformis TaxID=217069 RepID=A0ABU0LXY9_9HYPH|nr:integrase [Ancylobacter amanitiformis]